HPRPAHRAVVGLIAVAIAFKLPARRLLRHDADVVEPVAQEASLVRIPAMDTVATVDDLTVAFLGVIHDQRQPLDAGLYAPRSDGGAAIWIPLRRVQLLFTAPGPRRELCQPLLFRSNRRHLHGSPLSRTMSCTSRTVNREWIRKFGFGCDAGENL